MYFNSSLLQSGVDKQFVEGKPLSIRHKLKVLWSGTILTAQEASRWGSEVNATTIQVAISTLAAIVWMLKPENREKGVLEPEALPSNFILEYCNSYLGTVLLNYDCSKRYKPKSD